MWVIIVKKIWHLRSDIPSFSHEDLNMIVSSDDVGFFLRNYLVSVGEHHNWLVKKSVLLVEPLQLFCSSNLLS